MSLVNGIFKNIEDLFAIIGLVCKQDIYSYCDLETADSKHVLVTKDGSLCSVFKLHGYKRFVGNNEFVYLCERMNEIFQTIMQTKGHYFQISFNYEFDEIKSSLNRALKTARKTADRLQLDIDDIFESRVNKLADYCSDEDCYIVFWTTPECLPKAHLRQMFKEHRKKISESKGPDLSKKQNLFAVLDEIRNIHESVITTLLEDMQHTGYYADLLDVHEALTATRYSVDHAYTNKYEWKPSLPGDPLPMRLKPAGKMDLSDLMWPSISSQILPRDGENVSLKYARIGDTIYAPMYIEVFPKTIKPFYDLFRRMLPSHMPWRISYLIGPNGIKITESKNVFAQFLRFSHIHNQLICETHNMLKALNDRSDNPVITFSVVLCTWAKVGEEEKLKERASKMVKVLQSWGGCDVRQVSGDAMGLTMSSAVGLSKKLFSSATAAPLDAAVSMMPFVRPASPWREGGALLFRTPDGKVWPYQPGSSQQVSWIDIIYARSGSGKSVLLNTINLGLCLSSGLSKLPRISIIDIGPSARGFISLLREGLRPNQRHEVVYHRLTLDAKDAINPFDTLLGARYPTRLHRSFLINFISLLLVDKVEDSAFEGASSMISMILDETYRRFADDQQPKLYIPHAEKEVHDVLYRLGFNLDQPVITWWQVADFLFSKKEPRLALIAQRQAVPNLSDTIDIAHTQSIKDLYSDVKTDSGEDYITAYGRILASVIRNYPTLTSVTKLNLEGSRVVALDLDEVAKSGSAAADKQTAIMYMLARHVLAQNYFLHISDISKIPALYQRHHKDNLKEIMEEPKRMVFDEFHRTAKSPVVREQVLQDMREGRKWKIHISLASQSLKDFDQLMIEFATSVFILDAGSAVSVDETCKVFGLTETEKQALSTRVHGPTSNGATMMAQFVTKQGLNTQLLTSTISAVELWAFSTTTEDVYIRDKLYAQIGPKEARAVLALHYPKGSAIDEIHKRLEMDPLLTIDEVCENILSEVMMAHRNEIKGRRREKIISNLIKSD